MHACYQTCISRVYSISSKKQRKTTWGKFNKAPKMLSGSVAPIKYFSPKSRKHCDNFGKSAIDSGSSYYNHFCYGCQRLTNNYIAS